MPNYVYSSGHKIRLRKEPDTDSTATNVLLLGQQLVVEKEQGGWCFVRPWRGKYPGWIKKTSVSPSPGFKLFVADVGQGDGALIESPEGIIIVDGGQRRNFHSFLVHRYRRQFEQGKTVHIHSMIISHPDEDHYGGLRYIILDSRFTIGTIYHSGITRQKGEIEDEVGALLSMGILRRTNRGILPLSIKAPLSTIDNAKEMIADPSTGFKFRRFWKSVVEAHQAGRIEAAYRINTKDKFLPGFGEKGQGKLRIKILGPVPSAAAGGITEYPAFWAPAHHGSKKKPRFSHSHTRNGHSIVLRLEFGEHSFLLGGDLNIPAQLYLMEQYDSNPFRVDVAKSCHHGSSDFHPEFLKKVKPYATVCSSGDNKSYDHPNADAMGSAAKHSRGDIPLLFSTEIARAYIIKRKRSGEPVDVKIHYGMINFRSNGDLLVAAQMKEQRYSSRGGVRKIKKNIWDTYSIPWKGKYNLRPNT